MYRGSLLKNVFPQEYQKIAENLFPSGGLSSPKGPSLKAMAEFANALGIGRDFKKFLSLPRTGNPEMENFLENFQYNLDLLIQKTWVEKADEARKEKLQGQVPGFIASIKKGKSQQALEEFSAILDELANLFFGIQSTREDFNEYTFRIDEQIGLFWWYGSQLGSLSEEHKDNPMEDESLWALLLIGICYLTNF